MKRVSKIVLGILIFCFIVLTLAVKNCSGFHIDEIVYNVLISLKNATLTDVIKVITDLSSTTFLVLLMIIFFIIFKRKIYPLLITTNMINIVVINQVLKNIIQRPRPVYEHLIQESGFSFPSGHAMAAFGFYGFLIFLIQISNLSKNTKRILTITLSILIFVIGLTRIYLGVHYFTDVLCGFIVSAIYLIVFTNYIKKYLKDE